MKGQETIN